MWWKLAIWFVVIAASLWFKFKAVDELVADVEEEEKND